MPSIDTSSTKTSSTSVSAAELLSGSSEWFIVASWWDCGHHHAMAPDASSTLAERAVTYPSGRVTNATPSGRAQLTGIQIALLDNILRSEVRP